MTTPRTVIISTSPVPQLLQDLVILILVGSTVNPTPDLVQFKVANLSSTCRLNLGPETRTLGVHHFQSAETAVCVRVRFGFQSRVADIFPELQATARPFFGIVRGVARRTHVYVQWYYTSGPFQPSLLYVHRRLHLETLSPTILASSHVSYNPHDETGPAVHPEPADAPRNLHKGIDTPEGPTRRGRPRL